MSTYDSKSQENGSERNQGVLGGGSTTRKVLGGIKKSLHSGRTQGKAFGNFDYEQKYKEDLPGEEVGDYARVWSTYLDETEQYDRDKVENWKETIDVLLVFAGLFSAVITTFVIESSQNLQTDYTQVSANLLFELVQFQHAAMNGVSAGSISLSPLNPNTPFVPSITDSAVNALWFTSLALALVTALLSVLTKQWLYQYSSLSYGTPRERSRLRQFRTQGLETWQVAIIVEFLPVLMHSALALFLTGLVVFLIPLKTEIAWIVGVIAGIAYIFYIVSALLPLSYPQCPYTTILTKLSRKSWRIAHHYWTLLFNSGISYTRGKSGEVSLVTIKYLAKLAITPISAVLSYCLHHFYRPFRAKFTSLHITIWVMKLVSPFLTLIPPTIVSRIAIRILLTLQKFLVHRPRLLQERLPQLRNDREYERAIVQQNGISIDTEAIYWLYSASTNPSAQRIVYESICALPYGISGHSLIEESLYKDLSEFVLEKDYSALQAGTLRRLILARLHYDDTINTNVINLLYQVLDSQKIKPEDSGLAELHDCLTQDPIKILINSINDTTTRRPLVVWSFLFRHAKYTLADPAAPPNALAKTLLIWDAAKNLFTWSDTKITPVSDQEPITLSQLSAHYPDIIAKWIFDYLSNHFCVSISRKNLEFIVLGEVPYTRYILFKTIYKALTQSSPESDGGSLENDNQASLLSLVKSFKTYITFIATDESGWSDDLAVLGEVFEMDIMWSEAFFEDRFITPEARADLIQIYNLFRKMYAQGPVRKETMRCIHTYLVRLGASPTIDSQTAALRLLTVVAFPIFCKFLSSRKEKQNSRLDLVLIHSRNGMTGSHVKSFLSVYKDASQKPLTALYGILFDSYVLEELCRCMVIVDRYDLLLAIARLNPSYLGWKDCYKRLLNTIQGELRSFRFKGLTSQDNPKDTNPPFYQVFQEDWFSLYLLCYHLRSILKLDPPEAEFTLRELPDMFPETFRPLSQSQIRKFNALMLKKKEIPFSIGPFLRSLKPTLSPTRCVSNLDDKPSPV